MTKRKSLRRRLRQLWEALLPYPWVLRVRLRRLNRFYSPLLKKAKGDERETINQEWGSESAEIEDELDSQMTSRLHRIARRYYVTFPPTPQLSQVDEDENWTRGRVIETWAPQARWRRVGNAADRRSQSPPPVEVGVLGQDTRRADHLPGGVGVGDRLDHPRPASRPVTTILSGSSRPLRPTRVHGVGRSLPATVGTCSRSCPRSDNGTES
jgi:hypothetical protein